MLQINTNENPNLSARFAIRGIPALVLLKQGRVIDRLSGAHALEAALAWAHRHI